MSIKNCFSVKCVNSSNSISEISDIDLTKAEEYALKMYREFGYKFIARDKLSRVLNVYETKPSMDEISWVTDDGYMTVLEPLKFGFIKPKDAEPWVIDDILKAAEVD